MNIKKLSKIDDVINREIKNGRIAGAVSTIYKDGEIVYKTALGYENIETRKPIKENTIFRLYSLTKLITSVAVMIVYEKGLIKLDDPVKKYLSEYGEMTAFENGKVVPADKDITIFDLLTMTAGMVYGGDWLEEVKPMGRIFEEIQARQLSGEKISTRQLIKEISKAPLMFQPETSWTYGTCADVLGAVVEVATNKRFGEFLSDEIFKPLEMNDTGFYVPREKEDRFSSIYYYDNKNEKLVEFKRLNLAVGKYDTPPDFESGGAGLVSTIPDYLKLAKMLLNGGIVGDKKILKSETVKLMSTNKLPDELIPRLDGESNKGCGYGFLVRTLLDLDKCVTKGSLGEFGWDGWTGTYVTISPKDNMIFLYFIQKCGTGSDDVTRELRNIVYDSFE